MPSDVPGQGNTPWDESVSRAGTRPAATRPTWLIAKAPDHDEIYLLDPLRHWIRTPADLMQIGGPDAVTEVPAEYLDVIPQGADYMPMP